MFFRAPSRQGESVDGIGHGRIASPRISSLRKKPGRLQYHGGVMNIEQQFARVTALWSPKIIGRVNDQYVKIAKVRGQFTWHKHDDEDELFLIVKGHLRIQLEDGNVELGPGDFHVVPKGVLHNPVAEDECWLMLIETVTTEHTGNVKSALTKSIEQQLGD
ncbi:MAG: cupin domain-containing protein [Gemmatimonadaceae bacterium]